MNKIQSFILLATIVCATAAAQTPGFKKYQINQTGRYAYFPDDPGEADVSQSEDGSDVYTVEVEYDAAHYGIILVDFAEGTTEGSNKDELGDLLTGYLDFLKDQFTIVSAAGYGMGHTLESNPDANGVIDYWEDSDGTEYSIAGWIDSKTLAVLYITGKQPVENVKQMFLNGFRFK